MALLINRATGIAHTRDYREQPTKRKKKIKVEEIEKQNEVKKICLECKRKECNGNCKVFRTKRNASIRMESKSK